MNLIVCFKGHGYGTLDIWWLVWVVWIETLCPATKLHSQLILIIL